MNTKKSLSALALAALSVSTYASVAFAAEPPPPTVQPWGGVPVIGVNTNTCTSFTYSSWTSCSGGVQTRTVSTQSPTGCTGGTPVLSQSCSSESGGGAVVIPKAKTPAETYSPTPLADDGTDLPSEPRKNPETGPEMHYLLVLGAIIGGGYSLVTSRK